MALTFADGAAFFGGKFKLPQTTKIVKNDQLGALLLEYEGVQKVRKALAGFPLLVVGGAVRDLLRDPSCKPKDIDFQVVGKMADILAKLQETYAAEELKSNPIGLMVGKASDTMDAIDIREATEKYYDFCYVENDVNALMFDLSTSTIVDMAGTGVDNCTKGKFSVVAKSMEEWHAFEEPPRKLNGKVPRLLKMLAKGFTFADQDQKAEYVRLFATTVDAHCELVIAGKFSTFEMVLGQTVRGDVLNFKDGTAKIGNKPAYDLCIRALSDLDFDLGKRVTAHMARLGTI